jgi:hypothetical protein
MKMMEMGLRNRGFSLNGGSQRIYLGIVGYTGMNIIDNMICIYARMRHTSKWQS